MKKVSICIANFQGRFGDRRALEIAREIGADAVDFGLGGFDHRKEGNLYAKGEEAIVAYCDGLRRYAEELGIEIFQTHGRLEGLRNRPDKDEALIENCRLDCIATAALGARYCVVHTATTIHLGADAPEELMYRLNLELFRAIVPFAAACGIKVATETFGDAPRLGCIDFFGDLTHFKKGYEMIKADPALRDHVAICMDTGHSNKSTRFAGNPSVGEVIRTLGSDIEVLHLNDNNTLTDQHKPPMTGSIDWADVMAALEEIGYRVRTIWRLRSGASVQPLRITPLRFPSRSCAGCSACRFKYFKCGKI